jgi:hypothetical protein
MIRAHPAAPWNDQNGPGEPLGGPTRPHDGVNACLTCGDIQLAFCSCFLDRFL